MSAAAGLQPLTAATATDLLDGLFERARDSMSERDLRHLATLRDEADLVTQGVGELCNGVAAFIAADTMPDGAGRNVGSFATREEMSTLLWHISNTLGYARGLAELADKAEAALEEASAGGVPLGS